MIRNPLSYPGNKNKLLKEIIPELLESDNFVDVFCGSGVVGINSKSNYVYLNDISTWATAIIEALKNPVVGVYHYSNEGVCSWYDFTKMIAEYSGQTSCDIQPCHSDEFPSPVTRPSYSVLDKTKIKETFGIKVPYWTDSLKKCINHINKK